VLRTFGFVDVLFSHNGLSQKPRANFTKFSIHLTCGRRSVLLLRHSTKLCTSGCVDDIMFLQNAACVNNYS